MIWFLLAHIRITTGIRWPYWLYQVYLRSNAWRHKRQRIIKRANGRCETCRNTTNRLEVHHYDYSNLGNEPECDLFAVCNYCHKRIHNVI
jgi:chlorite dismutase